MERFEPGEAYGYHYEHFIWVCTNTVSRDFERCNLTEAMAVYQAMRQKIQQYGLGTKAFVFNSGCLLGCRQTGTTVSILSRTQYNTQVRFFQGVTVQDVDALIQTEILGKTS